MKNFMAQLDEYLERVEADETEKKKTPDLDSAIEILTDNWQGIGKDLKEEDVDPDEFKMGLQVEAEHFPNHPKLQARVVLDHLKENPKYYSEGKANGLFPELK
jgi:hypothetical protein